MLLQNWHGTYTAAFSEGYYTKKVDNPILERVMIWVINNLSSHYIHLNRIVEYNLVSKYYYLQDNSK